MTQGGTSVLVNQVSGVPWAHFGTLRGTAHTHGGVKEAFWMSGCRGTWREQLTGEEGGGDWCVPECILGFRGGKECCRTWGRGRGAPEMRHSCIFSRKHVLQCSLKRSGTFLCKRRVREAVGTQRVHPAFLRRSG